MSEKIGLGLTTASDASFSTFFVGENERTLERIRHGERIWLFGPPATGKTHVLRSLERESADARYMTSQAPSLDNETSNSLLLIDDIDQMFSNEAYEYALFAAYEATDFERSRWVVSASVPVRAVNCLFRDLASRMNFFEQVELRPVPESEWGRLLSFWAEDRAISISSEVVQYLLDRIPRTQERLWSSLQMLERATLLENRTLTIPFVREVLDFDRN